MPLTPADVRNKQFSTTRLRPGYDEEEVDVFLDRLEHELDLLIEENERLRAALATVLRGEGKSGDIPPLPGRDPWVADIQNAQFSTTRLRPGYDEEEVDIFLDEIEAEMKRLLLENGQLRARLTGPLGRNLTRDAREGRLDPVFGRWPEIQQVMSVLASRSGQVPLLVGEHGVGVSAVVRGVVLAAQRPGAPDWMTGMDVWEFDAHQLMQAGSGDPADPAQVVALAAHARSMGDAVVLFVENAFAPVTAWRDQARPITHLEPVLNGAGVRIIAAATPAEYRACVPVGSPLGARLRVIKVDELPEETAVDVLRDVRDRWESRYRVSLTDEAIAAAVALSVRHALGGRPLPGKAMDLIDRAAALASARTVPASARTVLAGPRQARENMPGHRVAEVTEDDVAEALAAP